MIEKLRCALGLHRYLASDTKCITLNKEKALIQYHCCFCGKQSCFLTTFKALEEAAEDAHRRMNDDND